MNLWTSPANEKSRELPSILSLDKKRIHCYSKISNYCLNWNFLHSNVGIKRDILTCHNQEKRQPQQLLIKKLLFVFFFNGMVYLRESTLLVAFHGKHRHDIDRQLSCKRTREAQRRSRVTSEAAGLQLLVSQLEWHPGVEHGGPQFAPHQVIGQPEDLCRKLSRGLRGEDCGAAKTCSGGKTKEGSITD